MRIATRKNICYKLSEKTSIPNYLLSHAGEHTFEFSENDTTQALELPLHNPKSEVSQLGFNITYLVPDKLNDVKTNEQSIEV